MSSIGSGGPTSWQASLFQAAGKGDEVRVRELVKEGAVHGDKYKEALRLALQRVAGRGHEPLTRLLLEEGAGVNPASENDVSALWRAAELGKDKIVRLLLDYGADIHTREPKSKRTAIFPAAQRNHRNTLSLLFAAGADVNAKDADGQNVLQFLASERTEKAAKWGEEIVQIILETNIDLEARDKEGRTALLWSAAIGKAALVRLLLTGRAQNNADIKATNNRGKTALHLAVENYHERNRDTEKSRDAGGNRDALVEYLLVQGASPHARSDGSWTPLLYAADKIYENAAVLLLKHGADVNAATSSGITALHLAARKGHIGLVELLLRQDGIRRNPKDSDDRTPMLGAAESGNLEIVKILSPADDGKLLSTTAYGACKGFQATVVDFGMENRPVNVTKHSIFDLLYGFDEKREKPLVSTLVRNIPAKPTFRWIHLPTNNMAWVEALLTKQFVENSASDVEGFKALEKSFSQLHRGPTVHSHFMRPLCQRMNPTTRDPPPSDLSESATERSGNEADLPIIVPPKSESGHVGDTQTPDKKQKDTSMKQDKQSDKKGKKLKKVLESTPNRDAPQKTNISPRVELKPPVRRDGRHSERNRTPLGRTSRNKERGGNIVLFMPYLHYETHHKRTKMSNAIKRAVKMPDRVCGPNVGFTCDEMLIQAYLQSTHNLHIRRTLDQFYYHAISTEDRDTDQVVYRYTRDKGKEKKVFMVDQLWLWILDKDLIVTAFPQRWEQPKNDPLNVLDSIIAGMDANTKSVYDLAILITGRCSGVFDRHRVEDEDYQFLDMFESSIGEVTNKETELFKEFNKSSVAAAQWLTDQRRHGKARIIDIPSADNDPMNSDPTFVDTLLDIGEETALLAETKDIRDELNMISMVLKHQTAILDDLTGAILEELKGNHNQQKQAEVKKRFREQHKVVEVHLKDVERMNHQAQGIYTSLTHLLDLKQKHANAFEARFARDQAAFTGRQGQTIMVFTIVTIVFLPMSFIAAFFAIPVREFAHDNGAPSLPLGYVSKIMFGIGLGISIPLITLAFAVDNVGLLIKRTLISLVTWRRDSQKRFIGRRLHRDRSGSPTPAEKKDMEELRRRRRSGESYRRGSRGSGYETDSDVGLQPMRTMVYRTKDEPHWNGIGDGSRDLERGVNSHG